MSEGATLQPHGMVRDADIRALATRLGAEEAAPLTELLPYRSIRSFHVGGFILRVDMDPDGAGLLAEAEALSALTKVLPQPISASVGASGQTELGGESRRYLLCPWIEGRAMKRDDIRTRIGDVGRLFSALHSARTVDLRASFPQQRPMTLLEAFSQTQEQLRLWMLSREVDGLGQDLLTLTLTDVQRAIRSYAGALDHAFLTARRRVVCHGRAAPDALVQLYQPEDGYGMRLVGFDAAYLGDAAEDLAALSNACEFDEQEESTLLHAYLNGLAEHGRPDGRFLPRYFARKTVGLLSAPIERLDRLRRLKAERRGVFADPVVTLEEEIERCSAELARGLNGLRPLLGDARPISIPEVRAMGRLISYEELILEGRSLRVALTGLPYCGKTQVGSTLAQRLQHSYVNTAALGRTLARQERLRAERGETPLSPTALVRTVFDAGLVMRPAASAPYYIVEIEGKDVTAELHTGRDQVRGAALLDEESVRGALRDEFTRNLALAGVVVEGHFADVLLSGRIRHFHLTCDDAVRRARLMGHRGSADEEEAAELLKRLDDASPPSIFDAIRIDLGRRTAAAGALEILWHLLPENRRPVDLSGRPLLYRS
ncbi:MAG: cytidylate kinase family protein [Myxococcota bacterium]